MALHKEKKTRKYTTRKGEGWDFIETALGTLIRRMAGDLRPLDEVELVYKVINFVKKYKEEKSVSAIAKKLEAKANEKK